jgi:hypothetical protein
MAIPVDGFLGSSIARVLRLNRSDELDQITSRYESRAG